MEKISAACAMEWSIELEKGLRSKKPGQPIEAILQIAPKLQQWSREPIPTMGVLDMFGLVPGQDRLFANTILLRLADAFKSGDKHIRTCILKVFISELNHRNKKGKQYNGILTKQKVPNHLELLRRVKIVFDTGDVESRSLALRLLGCWAHLANDNAEIRYMILSSFGSCHVLEVKASLFAAGCFCELSEDFASVVLEMLIDMVTSSNTSSAVRLAGLRTFAKMECSSLIASRAYKKGRKLALDSSEEEFIVEMLKSLTKLASKSMLLISEQVDLLITFLTRESALCVQVIALRCLRFLLAGGVFRVPVNAGLLKTLFYVLEKADLPPDSECETLQILYKIFLSNSPNLPYMDMPEFVKLVPIVNNATQSPIASKRFLALRLLVDIHCSLRGRLGWISDGDGSTPLPSQVVSLVMDQITLLMNLEPRPRWTDSEVKQMKQESRSLLNLILHLVTVYPELGVLVLDKIRFSIESVVNMHNRDMDATLPGSSVHEFGGFKGEKFTYIASKLVFCLCSFVEACFEILDDAGAITTLVLDKLKLLVDLIHQSHLFHHDKDTSCSLHLHSILMMNCLESENNESNNLDIDLRRSCNDYWVGHEKLTLEASKKITAGRNNWSAYKIGKYAACQGAWFAATFTFRQLSGKVQSDSCYNWLKSMYLFAHAESEILRLLFPKQSLALINVSETNEIWVKPLRVSLEEVGQDVAQIDGLQNYSEKLARAYDSIFSSEKLLASTLRSDLTFYFQRWFLVVRAKVLETVANILTHMGTILFNEEDIGNNWRVEGCTEVYLQRLAKHMPFLTRISFRLKRLAQEFDLLATSFMDMDAASFKIISTLALNCSLLAFCTGFVLYVPNLTAYENSVTCGLENSEKCSRIMLIQDLIERLWHVDSKTCTNLKLLLAVIGEPMSCYCLQSRTLIASGSQRETDTLIVCRSAVSGVLHMQKETNGAKDKGVLSQVSRAGLQLLSDILKKWMCIPFRTPMYFFQVRPCIGAELFAFDADTRNPDKLSILQGSHLALNLCVQLKNVPPDFPLRLTKLYCILASRPSYCVAGQSGESKEQTQLGFQACETVEMVDLNEKLREYIREDVKKTCRKHVRITNGGCGSVHACVRIEPNDRGQGFSTCLLDVSNFSAGSYKIKWHSCCIDSKGFYWSLLPLNTGPILTVKKPLVSG